MYLGVDLGGTKIEAVVHYIMPDTCQTKFTKAAHGDSSGVLGAARLWL